MIEPCFFLFYFCRVNRIAKIAGWFHIVVLFSFITGYYSNSFYAAENEFSQCFPVDEENESLIFPADLLCATLVSEKDVKSSAQPPVSLSKNQFHQVTFCGKSAELVLYGLFADYHFYSINIIPRLQPSDITFPFHYFW